MKKALSIILVLAIIFVFVSTGCGGKKSQQTSNGTPPNQSTPGIRYSSLNVNEVATSNISQATGGSLIVNDPNSPLNGLEIECPPGTLDTQNDVSFKVSYITNPPNVEPAAIVQTDHSMIAKLSERVAILNQQSQEYVYDPVWLTLLWSVSKSEPASQMLELEPSGYQFRKPVQVKLPLSPTLPQDFDYDSLMVLSGTNQANGSIKWEFLTDFKVDTASRTVTIQSNHFSLLSVLAPYVPAVVLGVPVAISFYGAGRYANRAGLAWYYDLVENAKAILPTTYDIYQEIIQAIVCSQTKPIDDRYTQPNYYDLARYLVDYEDDDSKERLAELTKQKVWTGLEDKMWDWLKTKYHDAAVYDNAGGQKKTVTYYDEAKGQTYQKEVPYLYHTVTWGDLFQQAMKLTSGDIFESLLLCHNTLRGLDRSTTSIPYINSMIELYRPDGRDHIGAAYHFFGLAAYAFNEQRLSTGSSADWLGDWLTPSAEFTNKFEKYVISKGGDITKDPTEFVIGNQGAEIGKRLFSEIVGKSRQDILEDFSFIDPSKDCVEPTLPPIRSTSDACDCTSLGLQFSSYSPSTYSDLKSWTWGCTNTDKDTAGIRLTLTIGYYNDMTKAMQAYTLFKAEVDNYRTAQGDPTTVLNENNRYGRITQHPLPQFWDNYNCFMEYQYGNYNIDVKLSCYHIDEARIKQLLNGGVDLAVKILSGEVKVEGVSSFH